MLKALLKILAVLFFGILGGVLSQTLVLPYLAEQPYFQRFQFVKDFKEREVIVKEEFIIQENTALQGAIEKVKGSVVGIKSEIKSGKTLSGSGLIVVSDGLVLTLADIAPQAAEINVFFDGRKLPAEVLQRKSPFVLLKLKETNLPTVSFADFEKVKPGERVFLVGAIFGTQEGVQEVAQTVVNEGVVKYYGADSIHTNIFEKYYLAGSSLFNIGGALLGINTIDQEGKVTAIPVTKIKEFLGF